MGFQNLVCPVSPLRVNENVVRIVAAFVILLTVGYLYTGAVYLVFFLVIDFYLRAFTSLRYSPLSWLGRQISEVAGLCEILIDKAPKIFAARVGFLFALAIALLAYFHPPSSMVLALVLIGFATLEALFNLALVAWFTAMWSFLFSNRRCMAQRRANQPRAALHTGLAKAQEEFGEGSGMTNEVTQKLPFARATGATAAADEETIGRQTHKTRSPWQAAWRQFRRHRLAMVGALALLAIIASAIVGPLLYSTPYNKVDFAVASQAPSWTYPFGTNDLGQDLLARVLWGGRISVAVSVVAMLVAITLGTLVGALAGFFGGSLDLFLMRVTDIFLSLPQLPLLLLIIYLFRDPITNLVGPELGIFALIVLIIGGLNWMSVARLVRANFLVLREAEFITAAHAVGVPQRRLILRHLLPNTLGPVIVAATLAVGSAIITESSLSFLGLGFPPDTPTWGRMLFEAQNFVEFTPSMALFPGLFIFVTVLSINYIGDGLRDALDPQLRSR